MWKKQCFVLHGRKTESNRFGMTLGRINNPNLNDFFNASDKKGSEETKTATSS